MLCSPRSAFATAVAIVSLRAAACFAQTESGAPDFQVDAAARAEVIERVLTELRKSYVLPDIGTQMEQALRRRMEAGEYEALTTAAAFAKAVTADLQAVSRDKHLRVRLSAPQAGADRQRATRQTPQTDNAGFVRVERLPGNIGYIDLRMFYPVEVAADHAREAMNSVAESDALIIDLRQNGGGSAEMVALLVSYLLEPGRILVNTFVGRDGAVKRETWTTQNLPGRRYTGRDVYLLTSGYTFSAAEEFAYDLKHLKRVTIVGETTGGGANPVDIFRINERFEVSIPVSRAGNPITKTNWEGTGVEPDVKVPSTIALETAHLAALRKRLESAVDAEAKTTLSDAVEDAENKLKALTGAAPSLG